MQNIDMMYLISEPLPENLAEKQSMRHRYKFFLDIAQ